MEKTLWNESFRYKIFLNVLSFSYFCILSITPTSYIFVKVTKVQIIFLHKFAKYFLKHIHFIFNVYIIRKGVNQSYVKIFKIFYIGNNLQGITRQDSEPGSW